MSTRSLADAVVAMLPQGTFQAIIAGDEVEHEKPHPDPYLRGAAALGIPTSACLAFEDSPTGLTSAHASGAVAIGVGRQFAKYLPSLYPYLKAGLANHREWQVCLTTVGALTDVCDAVGEELLPYCDEIVSL